MESLADKLRRADGSAELEALQAENEALKLRLAERQKFKDWTHAYLDAHGVPHHPPGEHGACGCRIGDRMDWLMAKLAASEAAAAAMRHELVNVVGACPSEEVTDPSFWSLIVQIRNLLSSTDAGKPLLEVLEAAKRLLEVMDRHCFMHNNVRASANYLEAKLKAAGL